jgi:2'-5' RNA ligase
VTAPRFTSFDDAWRWFNSGGQLTPVDEQRDAFVRGRAQLIVVHAPVTDSGVLDDAAAIRDALDDVPGLDWMPEEDLHVSLFAVGFQVLQPRTDDELLPGDVQRFGQAAADVIAPEAPVFARIGPVNVFPDALMLEVHDDRALAALRSSLRRIRSHDAFELSEDQFLPHVSLAFFAHEIQPEQLRERLAKLRGRPAVASTLGQLELVRWWFTGDDPGAHPEREVLRSYMLRGQRA